MAENEAHLNDFLLGDHELRNMAFQEVVGAGGCEPRSGCEYINISEYAIGSSLRLKSLRAAAARSDASKLH